MNSFVFLVLPILVLPSSVIAADKEFQAQSMTRNGFCPDPVISKDIKSIDWKRRILFPVVQSNGEHCQYEILEEMNLNEKSRVSIIDIKFSQKSLANNCDNFYTFSDGYGSSFCKIGSTTYHDNYYSATDVDSNASMYSISVSHGLNVTCEGRKCLSKLRSSSYMQVYFLINNAQFQIIRIQGYQLKLNQYASCDSQFYNYDPTCVEYTTYGKKDDIQPNTTGIDNLPNYAILWNSLCTSLDYGISEPTRIANYDGSFHSNVLKPCSFSFRNGRDKNNIRIKGIYAVQGEKWRLLSLVSQLSTSSSCKEFIQFSTFENKFKRTTNVCHMPNVTVDSFQYRQSIWTNTAGELAFSYVNTIPKIYSGRKEFIVMFKVKSKHSCELRLQRYATKLDDNTSCHIGLYPYETRQTGIDTFCMPFKCSNDALFWEQMSFFNISDVRAAPYTPTLPTYTVRVPRPTVKSTGYRSPTTDSGSGLSLFLIVVVCITAGFLKRVCCKIQPEERSSISTVNSVPYVPQMTRSLAIAPDATTSSSNSQIIDMPLYNIAINLELSPGENPASFVDHNIRRPNVANAIISNDEDDNPPCYEHCVDKLPTYAEATM